MPLIASQTKLVVFSDFDGTITFDDSNGTPLLILRGLIGDYLTDNLGFGKVKRLELNEAVLEKNRSFRHRDTKPSGGVGG